MARPSPVSCSNISSQPFSASELYSGNCCLSCAGVSTGGNPTTCSAIPASIACPPGALTRKSHNRLPCLSFEPLIIIEAQVSGRWHLSALRAQILPSLAVFAETVPLGRIAAYSMFCSSFLRTKPDLQRVSPSSKLPLTALLSSEAPMWGFRLPGGWTSGRTNSPGGSPPAPPAGHFLCSGGAKMSRCGSAVR